MDPVSNVWVVLHRVGPDSAGPLDSIRSDPRGRYSFQYVRTGSDEAIYFVSASYAGIAYFTPPLAQGKVSGDDAEIVVFDTTSGRAVHLRLPPNYPESVGFTSFEWLNDDTLALMASNGPGGNGFPGGLRYGDIVTCRLSSGSCHLAVPGPQWSSDADARVVPHLPIPE